VATPGPDNLVVSSGDDTLDGLGGADVMTGLAGNDTYYVNDAGDVVVELSNGGTDLVYSAVSYTLPANVEHLALTGSAAINGTGATAKLQFATLLNKPAISRSDFVVQ
jgi:Ca2+-binding RTX toxin-like protein